MGNCIKGAKVKAGAESFGKASVSEKASERVSLKVSAKASTKPGFSFFGQGGFLRRGFAFRAKVLTKALAATLAVSILFCALTTSCSSDTDDNKSAVENENDDGNTGGNTDQGSGDGNTDQGDDGENEGQGDGGGNTDQGSGEFGEDFTTDTNPDSTDADKLRRNENLDFIFDTNSVAQIIITTTREQWDTLKSNFNTYPKTEDCVKGDFAFRRTVGGVTKTWQFKDIGYRLRGNTSRCNPEPSDGVFVQAHFKLDFEEYPIEKDENGADIERDLKMAACMKGLILKRCKDDGTYAREVYAYNYFRKNGVWTAPRAAYTRLQFNIKEADGTVKKVNFGVYEMIENYDTQFIKARTQLEAGKKFLSDKGNLWKCTWKGAPPNLTNTSDNSFGVEKVVMPSVGQTKEFSYDLKTNKKKLPAAKTEITSFISGLNALSDVGSETDGTKEAAIKTWYEAHMDTDLFIKTYAINVILGMDDDYWCNSNNYYLYFDDGNSSKMYFIPYDYDNCLGTACVLSDTVTANVLDWGDGDNRNSGAHPLMTKLLQVSDFKAAYIKYLKDTLINSTKYATLSI